MKNTKNNLKENLRKLEEIASWFDSQDEVDVEAGLLKVKEGAKLVAESRARLEEIENEFEQIKKTTEERN